VATVPPPVAVASRSFSRNVVLRQELLERHPGSRFNDEGPTVLAGDVLAQFLRGHSHAITGLDVLDEAVFSAVPELRLVSKYGVGLDMIDPTRRDVMGSRCGFVGVNRQRSQSS
jgi:D-3-phosphoglycerate dehydrogenase